MKRTLWWVIFTLSAALAFFLSGCDEPNEPDLPREPYQLLAVYSLPTVAQDVSASGNLLAIAEGASGAYVLDMTDAAHPETLFVYGSIYSGAQFTDVALDGLHRYLAVRAPDESDWGPFPLFDITRGSLSAGYISQVGGNGPYADLEVDARPDSIFFYGSDTNDDFVTVSGFCRSDSLSPWVSCPFIESIYQPSHGNVLGFDWRSDGLIAVAVNTFGVHIHNVPERRSVSNVLTPGLAQDCAWRGDYLFVADRYHLTVVDVSTPTTPRVVAGLTIKGGDRLVHIVMDDVYAVMMDDNDGIYVADVSDPLAPVLVQSISLPEPTTMTTSNGRMYVLDEVEGLLVYSR
ncbi:MAG: hypothetical protein NT025_00020 [bacterium]|nr:hypothetical protein [bacterium]